MRWQGHSHRIQNERKSCSRSNESPMKRMRMKSFLLLVVHFCTFINQEENMSRTLLKAALALVLLWILVAWWSLGGAITETPPLCCGETQLSRSEREDQCPLPLFQPFVIPPTQPQPVVFKAYIRWRCGNITHSLPESIHLFAFLKTLPSSNPRDVVPLKYMFRPIKGHWHWPWYCRIMK